MASRRRITALSAARSLRISACTRSNARFEVVRSMRAVRRKLMTIIVISATNASVISNALPLRRDRAPVPVPTATPEIRLRIQRRDKAEEWDFMGRKLLIIRLMTEGCAKAVPIFYIGTATPALQQSRMGVQGCVSG